ncbi:type I polyketide synthase [Kutzneria sp. CA-103260]|uniref:type I polyketide synthase n=1 Tax=Kutzneria sp. CA-103260 TaxID=2802641 RepID=UPI001BA90DF6|nr:type I polyketide synthase [Kutzneria sp. CA-103260]QUQ67041.1 non-ribosomal peptide synthetase/polyketide synthase [Kutzneria sp. CA-103260]
MSEPSGLEVAVVGMAGRFPGAADIHEFETLIREGRNALTRSTDEELDALGVPASTYNRPDYIRGRGRIDGPELFDAEFFGYTPMDAALLDPQQRVFLECCWHALEDAGQAGRPDAGQLVGVYASASLSSYLIRHLLTQPWLVADVGAHQLLLSNDKDSLAARVSYAMDLRGPSVVVQSACSSSLLGVHLASQALISRDCDLALVGGAAIRLPQAEGAVHQAGGIMSPDGECRSFDAAANGTVGGNGVGVVVLKRLADAIRDGDTVHAVVLGSAVGNDGAARVGFTAPGAEGQTAVIRAALDVADVDPKTIGYVEGHGSATPLGDAVEVEALTAAFDAGSDTEPWCALGSVKSLVGHLDAAAGIAGFIKAVITVRDGVIPPSPHFTRPNPDSALERSPFQVSPTAQPWPRSFDVRRAGVSSFGMGGTSVHVIVEQPPTPSAPPRAALGGPEVLVLSAASPDALETGRRNLAGHLGANPDLDLRDVAHTLATGRRRLGHRMAVVTNSSEAAQSALDGSDVRRGSGPVHREVVLMFPGQGTQQAGMAAEPYHAGGVFRDCVDECAKLAGDRLGLDLVAALTTVDGAETLKRTRDAQPALFAVEYATAMLWWHRGIRPRAMIGHSIGEYAAAVLAGVMDLSDAMALVCERGRLMDGLPTGSMLAVEAAADDLPEVPGVDVAAHNAPGLSVLSGPDDRIAAAEQVLAERGVATRRLHTSHAFHSAMMQPIADEYADVVAGVRLSPPRIPFVSNVTGTWITDEQTTDPGYWAAQLRRPVRFHDGMRTLLERDRQVLLEVGPGVTLTSFAGQHGLAANGHVAVSSSTRNREITADSLARSWAALWVEGVDLDEAAVGQGGRRVPLPVYPFERARHWIALPTDVPDAGETEASQPVPSVAEPGLTDTQTLVTDVWRQLMGIDRPGLHDDFFGLGGHSLLATRILARIGSELGVELSVQLLFEHPTIAGLAAEVDRVCAAEASDAELEALVARLGELPADELRAQLAGLDDAGEGATQ